MGVPFFFRFLRDKYPSSVLQYKPGGNRSSFSFNNLYIDCNGLVHSVHGNDKIAKFIKLVEDIVKQFKPKGLLFLSFDGIAPLAKMKHQRKRRFKKAWGKHVEKKIDHGYRTLLLQNDVQPPELQQESFDSNSISPGTEFLYDLCEKVTEYFTKNKSKFGYSEVIISDSNVVGEGEQKIVHYIRSWQASENYDETTTHCVCGMDADFIFLALGLHNANIIISRGVDYRGNETLVNIANLRRSLFVEFMDPNFSIKFDFERIVDDFCALFILLGNDFLPSLPFFDLLESRHVEFMLKKYVELMWWWNNGNLEPYLIDREKMNLKNFGLLMDLLSEFEGLAMKELSREISRETSFAPNPALEKTKGLSPEKALDVICEMTVNDFDSSRDIIVKKCYNQSEQSMRKNFSQFGEIESVSFQKGNTCFIRFKSEDSVAKACKVDGQMYVLPDKFLGEGRPSGYVDNSNPSYNRSNRGSGAKMAGRKREPLRIFKCGFMDDRSIVVKDCVSLINTFQLRQLIGYQLGKCIRNSWKTGNDYVVQFHSSYFVQMALEANWNEVVKAWGAVELGPDDKIVVDRLKIIQKDEYENKHEKLMRGFYEKYVCVKNPTKFARWVQMEKRYKEAYYETNFEEGDRQTDKIVCEFLRGVRWVLAYYFTNSVLSYRWCYKFEYAPFASDMRAIQTIDEKTLDIPMEKPFLPLQQLAMILPAGSKELLPASFREKIVKKYEKIFNELAVEADFYRHVGKRAFASLEWTGIVKEPPLFDSEELMGDLLKDINGCELSEDEKKRNVIGRNVRVTDEKIEEFDIPTEEKYQSVFVKGHRPIKKIRPFRIKFM